VRIRTPARSQVAVDGPPEAGHPSVGTIFGTSLAHERLTDAACPSLNRVAKVGLIPSSSLLRVACVVGQSLVHDSRHPRPHPDSDPHPLAHSKSHISTTPTIASHEQFIFFHVELLGVLFIQSPLQQPRATIVQPTATLTRTQVTCHTTTNSLRSSRRCNTICNHCSHRPQAHISLSR
jgi:hypothetical protein